MHKVSFLGLKGGIGRTMLATQVAARACDNFNMVGLVDLDPTAGGSALWCAERESLELGSNPILLKGVTDPLETIERANLLGHDFLCLDGAPGTTDATRLVAAVVDVVILPAKCSADDLERAAIAAAICQQSGSAEIIGVVNDAPLKSDKRPYEEEMANHIKFEFESAGIPAIIVRHRDHFLRARNAGVGVSEMSGRGPRDAKLEIDSLFKLIASALGYDDVEASDA